MVVLVLRLKTKLQTLSSMSLSNTIGVISGINECVNLFQWVRSAISSLHTRWNGTQEQMLQSEVLHLQSGLQRLRDTLPAMYELIDRAEWRSHEQCVAELLPNLKDAIYDADDLLDEFRWYELKMELENTASQSPFMEFFYRVVQGSFNKVNDINERLNNISGKLESLRLCEVPQRFDKSLRPETSSFPNEAKIFGRDKELKEVMELLGVPQNGTRAYSKRKRESGSIHYNESRISGVPVLPIVGIGGVGKTTLVQHICSHPSVKFHFNLIIWTSVSDDFDVKRLTKEAIQSSCGKEARADHLDSLQQDLHKNVRNKRFLIILDDIWDDALKENGQCWKRFCAPLTNVLQGSMMLVTTRSSKVADAVHTLDPFTLDGLKSDIFWDFFKLCAFGSGSSNNDPELECIGRSILPKLKGSPLAAKTLGRLLRMNLRATHWNNILTSELWQLKQEGTDILPALQLSYMYLPFHLKRCFSFCAVFPKDYKFEKDSLGEIWVAEGFVEPQGNIPVLHIAYQYFEELASRSFFQKVCDTYVIHDLMHDMAQLVSKHECFILKDMDDFQKVPQNVRHLMILSDKNFELSNLMSICKYTKLRTLLCKKILREKTLASVMDSWCGELRHIRVFSCAYTVKVPESIGNLKHLRYFNISWKCPFNSLPPEFCYLYNLQFFSARKCRFESLPSDFGKLINLKRFELSKFKYHGTDQLHLDAANEQDQEVIKMMKNMNQICGGITITNVGALRKELAAEFELNKKKNLESLTLQWDRESHPQFCWSSQDQQDLSSRVRAEMELKEVLWLLCPPTSLRSLKLVDYPGESLPCWFDPRNGLENTKGGITGVVVNNNDCISAFSSLTDLYIYGRYKLSSLDELLQATYLPALKRLSISKCGSPFLKSLRPTPRFAEFSSLEELELVDFYLFNDSESLSMPNLKKLVHHSCRDLMGNIECDSLLSLSFSCPKVTSIPLQLWSNYFPILQELNIQECSSLTFIGNSEPSVRTFSSLAVLIISNCDKLAKLDDLLKQEYLPAIERIEISACRGLLSLPGERFGSFTSLKDLSICDCRRLNWQTGLVLPSSLRKLLLNGCGYFSAWHPSYLENLTSLVSLSMIGCRGITSIPDQMWSSNRTSIQELHIERCPDLVSIGGIEATAEIKKMIIQGCPSLTQVTQPLCRGREAS